MMMLHPPSVEKEYMVSPKAVFLVMSMVFTPGLLVSSSPVLRIALIRSFFSEAASANDGKLILMANIKNIVSPTFTFKITSFTSIATCH